MRINGVPQPKRHKDLGAKEVPPKHMREPQQSGGGGGSRSSGCALMLIGLAGAPWIADLLLVAS